MLQKIPDAYAQTTKEQNFRPGVGRNKTDTLYCQVLLYIHSVLCSMLYNKSVQAQEVVPQMSDLILRIPVLYDPP